MENGLKLALQGDSRRYTWGRFLEDVAERHGNKEAIRFDGRSISYQDLLEDARSVAKSLIAVGVVKGARVAVHMANRPEFAVTSFAVSLIGGVLVPVNTFATPAEREYILRHSDASVLLFSRTLLKNDFLAEFESLVPEATAAQPGKLWSEKLPHLRSIVCLGLEHRRGALEPWQDFLAAARNVPDGLLDAMADEVFPSDDGVIIYTSGTTAKPKGVLHLQRAPVIMSWRFAEDFRYTPEDRIWTAYPFFWSAGMATGLGACLGSGAVLVLQETFDPKAALECFVRESVTGVQAFPHQEKAMAEHPAARSLPLPKMKKLDYSSPLAPLVGITEDHWGFNGSFGMTETFTLVSNLPADSPAELRQRTAGRPLPGTQFRILDPQNGDVLATGVHGEIAVKSVTMMRGYYKVEPEAVFDQDGFYHTQDGGHLDADGYLFWTGRLSNMIKTGGANVSPLEIEELLVNYPDLRTSVAFGAPHPSLGQAVILCAIAIKGKTVSADQLRDWLKPRLAPYKRPKSVLMFDESDIELTGTQKIQINKLVVKAMQRLKFEGEVIDGVNYADYLEHLSFGS